MDNASLINFDPLFLEAALLVVVYEQGSYSLLQRKLMIGYRRVGAIIDQLEAAGIIGPFGYSVKRKIMFHDIDSLEIFFSTSLKLKLLLTTIHPYVSKQKVKIACFKNIIEILIIDEEYRIAYISAIENIISADELYKDFFNLLTRLYFWHETDTTNTDRIWPFQNVRLSQIGAKNLIKLLEKKSIPDSANHTVDGRGTHLTDSNYTFCRLIYFENSILCFVETEKILSLDFNCRIAGIELKVV